MTGRFVKHRPGWETVVVVATGPSLTVEQCEQLKAPRAAGHIKVLGVNCAYQRAELDALYACDLMFWKTYIRDIRDRCPGLELVTQDASAHKTYNLTTRVRGSARDGLGHHEIHTGSNGGHAAVNLAYLWGARRIILLGYDMKTGPNGERHWHADHPRPCIQTQLFDQWIRRFKSTAADLENVGVSVCNCTPGSALPWFPKTSLEAALFAAHDDYARRQCAEPSPS